jgi:hypothetical protein
MKNKENIAVLIGMINEQILILEGIVKELCEIKNNDKREIVYIGYSLHNYYCALEDILIEIARTFENSIDDISRYHRELLKRMTIDVPNIRPKVLSKEVFVYLDELRAFRHVFRHAYSYTLDAEKVNSIKDKLIEMHTQIISDIQKFKGFLEEIVRHI